MAESKIKYNPITWKYLGRDAQQTIPAQAVEVLVYLTVQANSDVIRGFGILPNMQVADATFSIPEQSTNNNFFRVVINSQGQIAVSIYNSSYSRYKIYWR